MPLKVLLSPKLNNILKTSSHTKDVLFTENTTVESVEPDKPLNSEKLPVDGQKNPSKLFSD
jgi:hypothetical protein